MKIRILAVLAAALFCFLESNATSQTLGNTLSRPFTLRANATFESGGIAGKTGNFVMFAPSKAKRVMVCVNKGAAGPTTVCLREKTVDVLPNTCKTWFTNREVTRRWGTKLPKRTKVTLKLPQGIANSSGWIHFLNT